MSLALLRRSPLDACRSNVYRTGPQPGSFTGQGQLVEGGPCSLNVSQFGDGAFDVKAVASSYASSDYFYPWLQRGVGWVKVPKSVPNGTIVLTGGVNGCTIVVTELLGDYFFYHDGDSRHLYPGLTTGREVARVGPADYDPGDAGSNAFQQRLAALAAARTQPSGDVSYGHFVIAVKHAGQFGLYVTGLMSLNGFSRLPSDASPRLATF